jgi:hypothetical protein
MIDRSMDGSEMQGNKPVMGRMELHINGTWPSSSASFFGVTHALKRRTRGTAKDYVSFVTRAPHGATSP